MRYRDWVRTCSAVSDRDRSSSFEVEKENFLRFFEKMSSQSDQTTIREQLGVVLLKYSFQNLLDTYSDKMIGEMLKKYVAPLNITTLQGAKDEIQRQFGYSPDMLIKDLADQEKIWYCCQEFMKSAN